MIDLDAIQTVSDCCGAEPRSYNNDCDSEDLGICPECRDHCTYIKIDENGEEVSEADIEAAKADLRTKAKELSEPNNEGS